MGVLDDAIKFAVDAHSGMKRKNGSPYILHPLEAAAIAGTMTDDENTIAAAVLHDIVEDTPIGADAIKQRFGSRVAELVAYETENKRKDILPEKTWKIRKVESFEELRKTNDIEVKIVWMGDKLSNMRAFYRLFLEKGDELWLDFNQKDKKEQEWYYRTIAELLSELKDQPAWQEYIYLLNKVF